MVATFKAVLYAEQHPVGMKQEGFVIRLPIAPMSQDALGIKLVDGPLTIGGRDVVSSSCLEGGD